MSFKKLLVCCNSSQKSLMAQSKSLCDCSTAFESTLLDRCPSATEARGASDQGALCCTVVSCCGEPDCTTGFLGSHVPGAALPFPLDLPINVNLNNSVCPVGMGIEFGTFMGTNRMMSVLPSTDSRKIKRYHISVPKRIIVTPREWKSGRFSMLDMNTALHPQSVMTSAAAGTINKAWLIESAPKYGSTFQNAVQITLAAIFVMRSTRPAVGILLI
ncbi:hypothetical protein GOODEAATRI_030921 [Goodea atripinnis]|uniref:Uncharacterized protein n=1 Tax=Goodea atripinnis TaxID=208336 RepID=A0ABV0Q384_9TELE